MKKTVLTRREFLKLLGVGTAVVVPTALGVGVYRSAEGEYPVERSPYMQDIYTADLDGSVPILLVVNKDSDNPFGIYLGEILRAEGLNCFQTTTLSDLSTGSLEKYEVVILAETLLNVPQVEMFESYVASGGMLIGMKPDVRMSAVFGFEKIDGDLADGYIKIDSNHLVGQGINSSTLQFHGVANLYKLAGAEVIAWLCHDRDLMSEYPAVTLCQHGKGLAALWAFDLAKSIVYTRQGNPAWSNQERDGLDGIRTIDLFKNWIDLERVAIPQADEQQRLFANLLGMSGGVDGKGSPLPRLWYFPNGANGILVATGDSHFDSSQTINKVLQIMEKYNGHMSVYYEPDLANALGRTGRRVRFWATDELPIFGDYLKKIYASPTPGDVREWRRRGHEFTLHPNVDWGLEAGWKQYWQEFTGRGYGPISPTVRTHRVLWAGWVESARLQASYGIRMNMDFYHVGPSLQASDGIWKSGYVTGSGQPMKFIDENGQMLNVYQQLTEIVDEHLIDWKELGTYGFQGWPKLSPEDAAEVYKDMLEQSLQGMFTPIAIQYHIDPFESGGIPAEKATIFMESTLNIAQAHAIPIWSAREWLSFVDARQNAVFQRIHWSEEGKILIFKLESEPDAFFQISVLIPMFYQDLELFKVTINNIPLSFQHKRIGNTSYAMLSMPAEVNEYHGYYR